MTQSSKLSIASKFARGIAWGLLFLLSILIALIASRYLTLSPEVYFPHQKVVYMAHTAGLLLHIIGSMLALLLGPFQFVSKMRKGTFLSLHRWMGRLYLLGVLAGGIGGLYLSLLAYGGLPTRLGFASLGILWLWTGFIAYTKIRNREIEQHRAWMIRNYALTFAAVTLRLWLPLFDALGMDFLTGYTIVAWLSWIPNLIITEIAFNRASIATSRQPGFAD